MKNKNTSGLDFIVDKLTNSVENVVTGDIFATEISILSKSDLKTVSKKMVGFFLGEKNLRNRQEMFIN